MTQAELEAQLQAQLAAIQQQQNAVQAQEPHDSPHEKTTIW